MGLDGNLRGMRVTVGSGAAGPRNVVGILLTALGSRYWSGYSKVPSGNGESNLNGHTSACLPTAIAPSPPHSRR